MENWIEIELKVDNFKNSIENGRGVFINSKFQQIKSMQKKKKVFPEFSLLHTKLPLTNVNSKILFLHWKP
jgi:hypothetical protein